MNTNWETVPILLKASDIANITGLSKPTVYALMAQSGFPAIRITDKRIVVPRDAFRAWLDQQAAG